MAARKDLLKAQAFVQQRLVSALVDREPDSQVPPLRRLSLGLFVSILVGALVVAGFGIYGFLKKPGAGLPKETAIIVDTEAGVVFVSNGQQLSPVTNMASARLITGGGTIRSVKTAALAGIPRGELYGIPQAPAQLPAASSMTAFPIRICSIPYSHDSRYTVVDFAAPADRSSTGVVLTDSGGQAYLVVNGLAHLVKPEAKSAIETTTVPAPATDALIQSLPLGEPIDKIRLKEHGNPARNGHKVGDVVQTGRREDKSSLSYWIMLADGWSRISYIDMRATQPDPQSVPEQEIDAAKSATPHSSTKGVPLEQTPMTTVDTTQTTICATYFDGETFPKIQVGTDVPKPSKDSKDSKDVPPAVSWYDRVTTAPGAGALLRGSNTPADGQPFLIWEGKKYGIPDPQSRAALGYGDKPPVAAVVEPILRMIPDGLPKGIALDHYHANRAVSNKEVGQER